MGIVPRSGYYTSWYKPSRCYHRPILR